MPLGTEGNYYPLVGVGDNMRTSSATLEGFMAEHVHGAPVGAVGYVEYRCRCLECSSAYGELGDTPRQRRLNGPTPSWVHGTWNGYSNYGCRCAKCLQACRETYEYASAWRKVNREHLNEKQRRRRAKEN